MSKHLKSIAITASLFILIITLLLSGCSTEQTDKPSSRTVELTVSAAASLTDALHTIQQAFEADPRFDTIKLSFNLGASGALQQQIEQGAPADLFLSAAPKNMQALVDQQLIDADKHTPLLTNELVLVVPADAKTSVQHLSDLAKDDILKLAIGIPESVPAGSYAKEALTNAGLWESLQPKTVQAKDVRQVLQYVETGNVDAGFVYKTDALTSDKVKIAVVVDAQLYTPAIYPIGILKASKHSKEAEQLYNYLQSEEALAIFVQHGFSLVK